MTNKQLRTNIALQAKMSLLKNGLRYSDIDINYGLPYFAIGDIFFAQGEDADQLIEDAKKTADITGLAVSTCLVWYLDSAGAL